MPKLNREQRFATLRNIFNELGELSAQRSAARLQIPADEARDLIAEWKGEAPGEAEPEYEAHEAPRPARVPRVSRQAAKRLPRPVQAARPPRPVSKPPAAKPTAIKLGEASLPPEKESGEAVDGYRGAPLRKGTHVRYETGEAVGVIIDLGPTVSVVKWFRTGAQQSEINRYLRKAK